MTSNFALSAAALACAATVVAAVAGLLSTRRRDGAGHVLNGIPEMIGNTALVRIKSLSDATGCEIFAKAEYLNPGGSTKDRIALQMIKDSEVAGLLKPGDTLVEGTSGSTGISLALLARALGYKCHIVMPDDQAIEKSDLLRKFGATVERVKPASITHPDNYVNVARRVAESLAAGRHLEANDSSFVEGRQPKSIHTSGAIPHTPRLPIAIADPASESTTHFPADGGLAEPTAPTATDGSASSSRRSAIFCDQFECVSNFRAHHLHTGPEIWAQTGGKVDAFVMGAGTGGTIAGVGAFLKSKARNIRVYLVDPPGSSLYNKVKYGVAFANQQSERFLKRHRYDTIIEGVGLDRVTSNFARALPHLDGAFQCTDQEAVHMARYLLANDGLFVGSSSAMNCVGAAKLARQLGPGHTIVTLLCDSGQRHLSRFWNDDHLRSINLRVPDGDIKAASLQDFISPS